ncbi:MAG: hypothetical protein J0M20_06700 [Burkholderiales bacterium]|nr:hypothetical protein [Burkholderiales bacterium]
MNWMRRLIAFLAVLGSTAALAQHRWREHAVPFVSPQVFVAMQASHWYQDRATDWLRASLDLQHALAADCERRRGWPTARQAWRHSALTWSRLSTVAVGPLVDRRSARQVDFQPTRPEAIRKALGWVAEGPLDSQRLGSAARGLPALEWLLWSAQAPGPSPGVCRYSALVAQDLLAEADALDAAFRLRAQTPASEEAAVIDQLSEALNQWLGGLDQLRMQAIVRPLAQARTRGQHSLQLPRGLAGEAVADRMARWSTLRALALFDAPVAPPAGSALVPIETMLRGTGRNALADRLLQQGRAVDKALEAARGDAPRALQAAAAELAALRHLVEEDVASALDIRIGFSDADGD